MKFKLASKLTKRQRTRKKERKRTPATSTSRSSSTAAANASSTNNCNTALSKVGTSSDHLDKSDNKSAPVEAPVEAPVDVEVDIVEEREEHEQEEDSRLQQEDCEEKEEERQYHHQKDNIFQQNASDNDYNHRSRQCCCGFYDFTLEAVSSFLPSKNTEEEDYLLQKIEPYSYDVSILEDASDQIKGDRRFILKAVQKEGYALQYASSELRADKEIVETAVQNNGCALRYASPKLRADRETVLKAIQENGDALQFASSDQRADKEIVINAIQNSRWALEHSSDKLLADRKLVLRAIQHSSNLNTLQCVLSQLSLRADKKLIRNVLQRNGCALQFAADELRADKEIVLNAIQISGDILKYASETLRSDKEVVITAVKQNPTALKFALGGLNQDPDCLKAAGLFNENYDTLKLKSAPRIVLSTKFSLGEKTTSYATKVALLMEENPYFASKVVYSPNTRDKNTCDPKWTDINFPCRGTEETCLKYKFEDNLPVEKECCWRSSYRYQLMRGKDTGGFMVQVAEWNYESKDHVLGDGQQIETELAEQVGLKVFRVYQQLCTFSNNSWQYGMHSEEDISKLINELVKCAESWCKNGCSDMSVTEVRLVDKIEE